MKRFFSQVGQAVVILLAVAIFTPARAGAGSFFYEFDNTFSGTNPAGSPPWGSVLFQDVSPGTVNLSISANGLTGSEYFSELYLNLNPNLNPSKLSFTSTGGSGGFAAPTISERVDSFKADGDGKYDILFNFSTSHGSTFTVGDYANYTISGIPGLTASDFDYPSAPAGGSGPFLAAIHVQSIGNGQSGWANPIELTPVPEPAPILLAVFAAGILGAWPFLRRLKLR